MKGLPKTNAIRWPLRFRFGFGVYVKQPLLTWMGRATAKPFLPSPWGPGEESKGQISFNFNYKVNFNFYTKLCVCSHKWKIPGLPLGGRTPYITSKNRLHTQKLHVKDIPRTSKNSLVRPKMDIETSCLQKKNAHIYQITWFMSRLRIGNSFIMFIDHARTSHLTDFESFIDSQCHV